MLPLTRAPFFVHIFDPQPCELVRLLNSDPLGPRRDELSLGAFHWPGAPSAGGGLPP